MRRKDEESPRTTTASRQDLLQSYTMQAEDSMGSQVKRRNNTLSASAANVLSLCLSLSLFASLQLVFLVSVHLPLSLMRWM